MKPEIHVQKFTDYRTFLVAYAQEKRRLQSGWSYGSWAKRLGLKTTSSITKIIQGVRDPGPQITERLVEYFQFNQKQAQFFRDLVRLHKIKKDPRLSVLLMEKMGKEHPDGSIRIMDEKSFLVISNWYYLALRELFRRKGFREDPGWISNRFLFKVTPREVSEAVRTLCELGFLVRRKNGNLHLAEGRLDTTQDLSSEAIKRYHEQMLEHAKAALRKIPAEEREVTSVSLLMSSRNLKVAKEMIRQFKTKFEKLMEEDDGDRVYQLQVQLFPLTGSLSRELDS